jgi:hypothetical protein
LDDVLLERWFFLQETVSLAAKVKKIRKGEREKTKASFEK